MRLWAKIVVGILAVMVLFCLAGGVLLVQSGAWGRIREFGGGVMGISQNAKGIEALDKKFPFQEPPDGAVSEDRLLVFIGVRKAVKPSADLYEQWIKAHEGKEGGDFREAREVVRLTGDVMQAFRLSLEAQKMSPREYGWLDRKVRDARLQSGMGSASETERDLLDTIRKASENPGLPTSEREKLKAKVKETEERLGGSKDPLTPNAALCSKYREELDATALGEFGGMMVQGFAQPGHRGRRHRERSNS